MTLMFYKMTGFYVKGPMEWIIDLYTIQHHHYIPCSITDEQCFDISGVQLHALEDPFCLFVIYRDIVHRAVLTAW